MDLFYKVDVGSSGLVNAISRAMVERKSSSKKGLYMIYVCTSDGE